MGDTIIETILGANPVVPVVTLPRAKQAAAVAEGLISAGIGIIEVTLRTEAAFDAITDLRRRWPALTVGAGTVRTPEDFTRACDAGAQYLVSPGATPSLIEKAAIQDIPWLPAGSTVTEIMHLVDHGYRTLKFFPARFLGGPEALATIRGPIPDVSFCPSGGIDETNFMDYLALDNVIAVAGAWMTPSDAIEQEDAPRIEQLARATLALITDQVPHS